MSSRLKIVLVSSEAVPFSKTGGLGDVTPALARALDEMGHQVTLIIPHYPQVPQAKSAPVGHEAGIAFEVGVGSKRPEARILWSDLPRSNVTVLQIENAAYFDRAGLYQEDGAGYPDNSERFIFFCRAAMEAMQRLILRPDIIHVNDWQTGLIPALLQLEYRARPGFHKTATVCTIHNLLFQGRFGSWDMNLTGLDWKYFNWQQMESYNDLNLLKTGIVFSEKVTTVSPGYAKEIQTPEFGCELEPVLESRSEDLIGILNGIDTDEWSPSRDPHLPTNYNVSSAMDGKAACKRALQTELGLPEEPDVPMLAVISRITGQKGFDLLLELMNKLLKQKLQLVILGTGEEHLEQQLQAVATEHSSQISVTIGYDEALAHRIEAAADIFLMPSAFEPCGLNQLYSMRYGTVPIVRAVGGLGDSVTGTTKKTLADETATGFSFTKYEAKAFWKQIEKALQAFGNKTTWKQLVRTGMTSDFSWKRSAEEYVSVYHAAMDAVGTRTF